MAVIEINDSLNIRTMSKYFKNVIKSADYNEDMTIKFPEDSHLDLAGLQILYAIKKELVKNQKTLTIEGLDSLFIEYFGIINDK